MERHLGLRPKAKGISLFWAKNLGLPPLRLLKRFVLEHDTNPGKGCALV
jgi:hypothetical protein